MQGAAERMRPSASAWPSGSAVARPANALQAMQAVGGVVHRVVDTAEVSCAISEQGPFQTPLFCPLLALLSSSGTATAGLK